MLYQFEFRTYQRKFKRPLRTSHGIWDTRSGIILRLVGENNRIGWGEIAKLCPAASLEIVPKAGHNIHFENIDKFGSVVRQFYN